MNSAPRHLGDTGDKAVILALGNPGDLVIQESPELVAGEGR